MGACLNYAVSLESLTCPNCGCEFAAPDHLVDMKRKNKSDIFCPNGHAHGWYGPNATERELIDTKARLAQVERDAAFKADQIRTLERKAKKQTRRIHAGVCPHCNRTFAQLAAHMQSKHADKLEKK